MRILQFGGGNFLRAFFDWMLQKVTDATGLPYDVTLVRLTDGPPELGIVEAGAYHVLLRGYEGDRYIETLERVEVVTGAVSPFTDLEGYLDAGLRPDLELVVSNSTEAGIYHDPNASGPHNFPSFLALLLHERARRRLPPLMLMAMELNDRSGDLLKKTLLQYGESLDYGPAFFAYVEGCTFYNTLVDRIVPGYPADAAERVFERIGERDEWLTSGELFHLLVIEGDGKIMEKLPFGRAGLNVVLTADRLDFYHDRKVRILNGAHTSSVPVALSAGIENVDAFASDPKYSAWLSELMHGEICYALDDAEETHAYADEVLTRFRNPALGHKFRTIALNTISKADARLSPTLRDYYSKKGSLPPRMMQSVEKLCEMYGHGAAAEFPNGPLELKDYSQLKGVTLEERLQSFFPSLSPEILKAMRDELQAGRVPRL